MDTATTEGRTMFGMLSVLAELQRELIVANSNDGLASAPGPRPGRRRPKLTPRQDQDRDAPAQEDQAHEALTATLRLGSKMGFRGHIGDRSGAITAPRREEVHVTRLAPLLWRGRSRASSVVWAGQRRPGRAHRTDPHARRSESPQNTPQVHRPREQER
ncbi:recombinase family protein [Streptomyces sp. NBC_00510]